MSQAQPIVCFDTQTLVWGIRQEGPSEKVKHAKYLFDKLDEEEAQIIIPSVVITEYVTPLATSQARTAVIAEMSKRFIVAPFDAKHADKAAELWRHGKTKRQMKKTNARIVLRADTLIIATAWGYGVQTFYTDDGDCFDMAKRVIPNVQRVSEIIAPSLFADMKNQ